MRRVINPKRLFAAVLRPGVDGREFFGYDLLGIDKKALCYLGFLCVKNLAQR
jgi:hypothetical protein